MARRLLLLSLATIMYMRVGTDAAICLTKICHFDLKVERGSTMTYTTPKATYNVVMQGKNLKIAPNSFRIDDGTDPLIGSTVAPNQVITADGYPRNLFTVNGKFPGDPIEVVLGAMVVVRVTNLLLTDSITIHWHGLLMEKTPWMDGVGPHGQCPIEPLTSFTYRFKASPVGTHWYHDHYENQRRDGLYGMIVVHEPPPAVPSKQFEFNMFVTDWYHAECERTNMVSPSRLGIPGTGELSEHDNTRDFAHDGSEITAVSYVSSLINGKGRFNGKPTPLEVFNVKPAAIYRFRMINSASERGYMISVDKHQMTIVALDGSSVVPRKIDFIIIYPGERVDFKITTKARFRKRKFWLRAVTLRTGKGPQIINDGIVQGVKAIIKYTGATDIRDPTSRGKICTATKRCTVFNCPYGGFPANKYRDCINVAALRNIHSQDYMDNHFGLQEPDANVDENFFNWANVGLGTSVNGRKTIGAKGIPLYQGGMADYITPCGPECDTTGCICTYYVAKDYNKTIQFVFTNYDPMSTEIDHHPIHTHGIHFAVLKMGYPSYDPITGRRIAPNPDIVCNNNMCTAPSWSGGQAPALNKDRPPVRDTIIVPSGGYVVLRFRTTNPGLWFIHCHMASHAIEGMGFYFFEAVEQIPPVPPNFPTCGHYEFTEAQYNYYQKLPVPGVKPNKPPKGINGWGAP